MPSNNTDNIYSSQYNGNGVVEASNVAYDNENSGLLANTVQGAIDEVQHNIEYLTATEVEYSNLLSHLNATDTQGAIDEINTKSNNLSTQVQDVQSSLESTSTQIQSLQSAIDEVTTNIDELTGSDIAYNNATSELAATNVQAAIDEVTTNIDELTGSDIAYDNATSKLAATNVQAAIDESVDNLYTPIRIEMNDLLDQTDKSANITVDSFYIVRLRNTCLAQLTVVITTTADAGNSGLEIGKLKQDFFYGSRDELPLINTTIGIVEGTLNVNKPVNDQIRAYGVKANYMYRARTFVILNPEVWQN